MNAKNKAWEAVFAVLSVIALFPSPGRAEIAPLWSARLPTGSTLYSGLRGMWVDGAGNTYVAGNTGISSNVDVLTAKFGPDGGLLWSSIYDGAAEWHDTVAGVALGPDGSVFAVGSTPGAQKYADLLLLRYDGSSGSLMRETRYDGGVFVSDGGTAIAVDPSGNAFAGGSTVGDGGDCLTVKVGDDGAVQWASVWDGPASAPYSQEAVRKIAVDPFGDVIMMTGGVMNSLHPDYVLIKYDPRSGSILWMSNWGFNGGEEPNDMVMDEQGDIYVTGVALDFIDKFGTVKFRNSDGQVLWAEYDSAGYRNYPAGIALDGRGGVYVTGSADPDGNRSNFNDNFFTVKRDAITGALQWSHLYGDNCIGCYDITNDVAVDRAGHVLIAGSTSSPPYNNTQMLMVLDGVTGQEITRGTVEAQTNEGAGAVEIRLDSAQNIYIGGDYSNFNTGAQDILIVKYAALRELDCDAIQKFSSKCRNGKLVAKLASSLPAGTELTLVRNGGDEKILTVSAKGKGKASWKGQSGAQTVCIADCPQAPCAPANCE